MTREEHRQHHIRLHAALDELVADWIAHEGGLRTARLRTAHGKLKKVEEVKLPHNTTIEELVQWSYRQTIEPDEGNKK